MHLCYTVAMTTLQVRTDAKLKKSAQKVLKNLGLDLSTAINMYLVQITLKKAIPFEIRTENGFTPAQERQMIKETQWALKHGKRYSSVDELFVDILKDTK